MPSTYEVVAIGLKGVIVALGLQALWDIVGSYRKIPQKKIFALKAILTISLSAKAAFHATYDMPVYDMCFILSKICNTLYQISMTSADWILLARATLVIVSAPTFAKGTEYFLVVVRVAAGVVDVFYSGAIANPGGDGTCIYIENFSSGTFYSVVDLFVDIYVTAAITIYLWNHSHKLRRRFSALYAAIVSSNLLRTVILLTLNTATIVIDSLPFYADWEPIVWLGTNIAYILTIAYDADMIKMMASLTRDATPVQTASSKPTPGTSLGDRHGNAHHVYVMDDLTSLTEPQRFHDKNDNTWY